MIVPVELTCPKCRDRFMGSDMVSGECPSCFSNTMEAMDFRKIEIRILAHMNQAADVYGTVAAATTALEAALSAERLYRGLPPALRLKFTEWAMQNAGEYMDTDAIDWIGAFYDWMEN